MKTKLFSVIFAGILVVSFASKAFAGNYALISDIGTSAKMIAVGNIEGFTDSASTVFDNPAGLSRVKSTSVAMFTTTLFNESNFTNFCLSSKTMLGTFGIGFMENSVRDIAVSAIDPSTSVPGAPRYMETSSFDYRNTIIKASYQTTLPMPFATSETQRVSVGASATQYTIAFENVSGRGYNADLGAAMDWEKMSISVAAKNIIPSLPVRYADGTTETLPLQIIGGIRYKLLDFDLMLQMKRMAGNNLGSAGIIYSPEFFPFIQFLAGYKEMLGPGLSKPKNDGTLGIVLRLDGLQLHYAYEKSEVVEFDNNNYFSVSVDL